MSHASLSADELNRMRIPEKLVKVSVGIEDIEDLIEDFNNALPVC
ncbi:PLP-dependent transferase [Saccharolobus sp.]